MASYLLVAGLIAVPPLWFLRRALVNTLENAETRELRSHLETVRDRLADVTPADLDARVRDLSKLLGKRITYIDRRGVVLSDSDVPREQVPQLENHAERPEVAKAL